MTPQLVHHAGTPTLFNLRKVVLALWERAWLILLCLAVGGAIAVLYLARAPQIFAATAVLKYEAEQIKLFDFSGVFPEDPRGQSLEVKLNDIRRMLLSSALLKRVAETANLAGSAQLPTGRGKRQPSAEQTVASLREMVHVDIPKDDVVIAVTVRHRDAAWAARVANTLVDELIAQNARSKEEMLKAASNKLQELLRGMQEEWAASEKALGPSRDQSQEFAIRQRELSQVLADLTQNLISAGLKRIQLKMEYNEAVKQSTNVDALLRIPAIAGAANVGSIRSSLLQNEVAFSVLAQRYKEKHPKYIEAQNELEGLRKALAEAVTVAVQQLEVTLQTAEENEKVLQQQFEQKTAEARAVAQQLAQSTNNILARQVQLSSTIHDRVVQRLKEATLAGDLFSNPLRVDQRAEVPTQPAGPDKLKVILAGLLAGLALGLVLALVFGLGDTSLKTVDETELLLKLPVLCAVPKLRNTDTEMAAAEGFRSLRTSISVQSKGKDPRSLLFTSASADEGKTFCALNYAVGLAQRGLKTVLVECDLRRPMVGPSLAQVRLDSVGVSDYLKRSQSRPPTAAQEKSRRREPGLSFAELRRKQHGAPDGTAPDSLPPEQNVPAGSNRLGLDEVLQRTEVENLFVISAGTPVRNPSELLAQQGITHLLTEVLGKYDRVIIDSAPTLGVSDTLLLASSVQGVCFVVRAGLTPRRAVLRAIEILQRADAPLLGVVLNCVSPKHSDPYGQDYYYHRAEGRQSAKGMEKA